MTGSGGRRARRTIAPALVLVALTGAVTGCSHGVNSSRQVLSASQGVDRAEQLVLTIAARVSPGAAVVDSTTKAGPDRCRSPFQGEVYYTIFKTFPAPTGEVGAATKDAVTAALDDAGFTVRDTGEAGGWPTLTGTASYIGLQALLSPDTPEVRLVVDTPCGAP